MIPALVGASHQLILKSLTALSLGSAAGVGYSYGRKVGRKACVILEGFEDRIIQRFKDLAITDE